MIGVSGRRDVGCYSVLYGTNICLCLCYLIVKNGETV